MRAVLAQNYAITAALEITPNKKVSKIIVMHLDSFLN